MTVATDQPITKAADDRFGRREFSVRIARVISSLQDHSSIVISINAPWGEGKTSVLNMIEEELGQTQNVLIIKFNPWRFTDEEQLLRKYFSVLSAKLGASLGKGKEVAKAIKAYADAITPLAELAIPIAGKVLGETVKSISGRATETPDLEKLKEKIEKLLVGEKKRIVVMMDDIDRLDRKEIQVVFRLVKLTADFPWTAYILAFDNEKVAAALAEQFGGQDAGHSFLEKIVQVPLPVPPASPLVLRKMVFEGVDSALKLTGNDLTQEEGSKFVTVFDNSFKHRLSSPRAVKRYTNMLNFVLPILAGEANMLDLTLIEGVRAFFPKLYAVVRNEPELFISDSLQAILSSNKDREKALFEENINKALVELTTEEKNGALFVLHVLFPHIHQYGIDAARFHISHGEENAEENKRIFTNKYFERYFNYGIPPYDLSDREVTLFIESLPESDIQDVIAKLEALSAEGRAEILVHKLRMHEDTISSIGAEKLAIAIAKKGEWIPESHPDDNLFGLGVMGQAASLLRQLIGRIDNEPRRETIAKDVMSTIARIPFAYEFKQKVRKLRKEQGSDEFVRLVSDECEREVGRILADKLIKAAQEAPLEDTYPKLSMSLYIEWHHHNLASLRTYAQDRLETNPCEVNKFIGAVVGASIHMFENSAYPFLTEIIPADKLLSLIRRCHPETDFNALPSESRWVIQMSEQASSSHSPLV